MKTFLKNITSVADLLLVPMIYPTALMLKYIRRIGVHRFPLSKQVLLHVGVFPIRDHYYEPLFDGRHLRRSLKEDRNLPGIDWNIEEQLGMLGRFHFEAELSDVPRSSYDDLTFNIGNRFFGSGDAEYWYQLLRLKKPRRIIEVGGGNSTLIAVRAIRKNNEETGYQCDYSCVEPYEIPWLEKLGISVIRSRIEEIDKNLFSELGEGDILFIDSSHIIRAQGDVLFEYLELLPSLNQGVIVHVHDIFSPRDYPDEWVRVEPRFWNEQYLLEAFLTSNRDWKIVGALNFLHHQYYETLKSRCPFLSPHSNPGSFYIQKIG